MEGETIMQKTFAKFAAVLMAVCMLAGMLVACGGQEVSLEINDMGSKTAITTSTAKTVKQAIADAEITLGEKDETEPALDTKITADLKEIIVKRYAKVTVVIGNEKKEVELVGGTVEDAIKKSGIKLEEGMTPDVPATDYVKDGMTITLTKGMKVSLTVDGKTTEIYTKAATVADFIKEQKITLGENDELSAKKDAKITDGMKLSVLRVEYKEEKKTEKIAFETEETYSDSLSEGESQVTQDGVDGEKEVTYKVKYVNGKEKSREAINEKVTKKAVNKIVTYGTASSGNDSGSDSGSSGSSGGSSGGGDSGSSGGGRTIVSTVDYPDCDGSGHGYREITYSDGTVEYQDY